HARRCCASAIRYRCRVDAAPRWSIVREGMIRPLGETWALPWSLVGYVLALATGCERIREGDNFFWFAPKDSALWAEWMIWSGFEAITIGTVTICAGWPSSTLLDHEARHQRQARILGPFYVPVYLR